MAIQTTSYNLLKSSLVLLILLNTLCQIHSAAACPCRVGYECKDSICVRKNCSAIDCSSEPTKKVCAFNGVTYDNMCELNRDKCVKAQDIIFAGYGECVTLPPPPEQTCSMHRDEHDSMTLGEYEEKCVDALYAKLDQNQTLTLSDLKPCYRPRCNRNGEDYAVRQCHTGVYPKYCWCSSESGTAFEETLRVGLSTSECENLKVCVADDGREYADGALFIPPNQCGLCECKDGKIKCYTDYVPNEEGKLSEYQLNLFKDEVSQMFFAQYNHNSTSLKFDIRHIHEHRTVVSEASKRKILLWKFNHYDRSSDYLLFPSELHLFSQELDVLLRCNKIFKHIIEEIDEDKSEDISRSEWGNFFGVELGSGSASSGESGAETIATSASGKPEVQVEKRSISSNTVPLSIRKPLDLRKKFLYKLI